jgi:hypothetical protein
MCYIVLGYPLNDSPHPRSLESLFLFSVAFIEIIPLVSYTKSIEKLEEFLL